MPVTSLAPGAAAGAAAGEDACGAFLAALCVRKSSAFCSCTLVTSICCLLVSLQ
jgi:hypothetical protein